VFENIPSLQVLNLAHNELSKLDQSTFNSLLDLRMLRLDNNRLEDINGLLTAQTELRWLNISANKLQWFDYAFIPKNLKWLDIHENEIEELGNYYALKGGFNLQTLDASRNRISKLVPLSLPTSLEFVFLNENAIKTIEPNTFIEKPLLSRVEIKGNNIEHLELSALAIATASEGKFTSVIIFEQYN
jgi:Leucine-rich repeat (LRR) protein